MDSVDSDEYVQKEWTNTKLYKDKRNANEGAGKTGGKNGGQNERNVTKSLVDWLVSRGWESELLTEWVWPTKCLPSAITLKQAKATAQKRRCHKLTKNDETMLVVTSVKYEIDLTTDRARELRQEIPGLLPAKEQEVDILILKEEFPAFFLEVSWQDVEGNAVDRQWGSFTYKFPVIDYLITPDKIAHCVYVTGPAFNPTLDNNKIQKGNEFRMARTVAKLNGNQSLDDLLIGDVEFPLLLERIKTHFKL